MNETEIILAIKKETQLAWYNTEPKNRRTCVQRAAPNSNRIWSI